MIQISMGLRKLLLVLAVASQLSACGGGGDSSSNEGAPAPPSGNLPTQPIPASPTGLIWHTDFTQNYDVTRGSFIGRLGSGTPVLIDDTKTARPAPDGSTFASFVYNFRTDITVVTVSRMGNAQPLHRIEFNGYVRDLQVAPTRPSLLLARWGSTAISTDDEWTVLDLNTRSILNRYPGGNTAAGWLPDGRFIYLSAAQVLSAGSVGTATLTTLGTLGVAGRVPRALQVNATGTQLLYHLVRLDATGNVTQTDLWVSRVDAGGVRQLTDTGLTVAGFWSPDGQYIAFEHDTGAVCTGLGCAGVGRCETKVVSSTATRATLGAAGVSDIRLRDQRGVESVLGCRLLGWTP